MAKPTPAVAAAIASQSKREPPKDKLIALQMQAHEARDLELIIASQEEALKANKEKLLKMYQVTLPDLLEEIGLDRIGLPPVGNNPGFDYVVTPYYSASIAARWSDEAREDAFSVLKKYKAEDLIKTEISAKLPKGSLKVAKQLQLAAKKLGIKTELKLSVHAGTLSAWLRETYEKGRTLPMSDLAKIGGSVGRVVKPEERKDD